MTGTFVVQEITGEWASPSSSLQDFNFSANSARESLLRSRLRTARSIEQEPEAMETAEGKKPLSAAARRTRRKPPQARARGRS